MNHYLILFLIILGCGLLGGIINYVRISVDPKEAKFVLYRSILTGLGASGLVPLFLKMISSDLLTSSSTNPVDYFVVGGFCLISSIFSSKFIDTIGDKLINQIDQVSKEVNNIKIELEDVTTENEFANTRIAYEDLDDNEKDILLKIYHSKFTYRSITGIASETSLTKDEVKEIIESLEDQGYVLKSKRQNNSLKWKITEKGREIIGGLYGDEGSGSGSGI